MSGSNFFSARASGLHPPSALDLDSLTQSDSSAPSSPETNVRVSPMVSAGRTLALGNVRRLNLALPDFRLRRDSESSLSSGVCSPIASPFASPRVGDLDSGRVEAEGVVHDEFIASPCPSLLSRVREGKRLGAGSFGQVFQADYRSDEEALAQDPLPQVPLVLKKLSVDKRSRPGGLRAFKDELAAMHTLNGVSSPRLMDYSLNPLHPRYLMTRAEGVALNAFDGFDAQLHPEPLVREQTAKKLAKAMLDALNQIQSRGYCHRDIKPDNVFVKTLEDGSYKITFVDLGFTTPVSKVMDTHFGNSKYTLSCEIERSAAAIDLYSVGASLYAMAGGGELDPFVLQPSTDEVDTHSLPTDEMFAFVKFLCSGEHESIAPALNHQWLKPD